MNSQENSRIILGLEWPVRVTGKNLEVGDE